MNPTSQASQDWLREHGPRLVLLARQWVACHADAEDVVQIAFMRFWPLRGSAHDPLAYLYRSVRNTAMNYNRSKSRRRTREQAAAFRPDKPETMFTNPADQAERIELNQLISDALRALPIEQREVVVMRTWSELSFDAIGQVMDTPARTAQSRYRYGIEALRQQFQHAEGTLR